MQPFVLGFVIIAGLMLMSALLVILTIGIRPHSCPAEVSHYKMQPYRVRSGFAEKGATKLPSDSIIFAPEPEPPPYSVPIFGPSTVAPPTTDQSAKASDIPVLSMAEGGAMEETVFQATEAEKLKSAEADKEMEAQSKPPERVAPTMDPPFWCKCAGWKDGKCGNGGVVANTMAEVRDLTYDTMMEKYGPCARGDKTTGWTCFDSNDDILECPATE